MRNISVTATAYEVLPEKDTKHVTCQVQLIIYHECVSLVTAIQVKRTLYISNRFNSDALSL